MINIALPKGRLGDTVLRIFGEAGYCLSDMDPKSRKLVLEGNGARYFFVKPTDVPIYVERGAADIGIAGSDIILEHMPDVYELSDLGIGKCRMCVAAMKDFEDDRGRRLKVATKFPNIASEYYRGIGRSIDIIKLNGSIELAPLLGLSDVIVDIVETGATLRENGLVVMTEFLKISAQLIANKASYKFKYNEITELRDKVSVICENK